MLVEERAAGVFFPDVFDGMGPWDIEDWVGRRGFEAFVEPRGEGGWEVSIQDPFHLFGLTLVKTWWRALGRDPVEKALGRLADHVVWLPTNSAGCDLRATLAGAPGALVSVTQEVQV